MPTSARPSRSTQARRLRGKLAAIAGATGAVAAGSAEAVTYTPTAGVVAAQGIPGFSFVDANNVTLGALRPPSTSGTSTWDVDGTSGSEFRLLNSVLFGTAARLSCTSGNNLRGNVGEGFYIQNLTTGVNVNTSPAGGVWQAANVPVTAMGSPAFVTGFTPNVSGQFGFRFFDSGASDYRYGWASMVIDSTGTIGQRYKITEAYYGAAGNTINVGAVPVPEPANIALLALGSAGVTAWRLRRKQRQVG